MEWAKIDKEEPSVGYNTIVRGSDKWCRFVSYSGAGLWSNLLPDPIGYTPTPVIEWLKGVKND